tara:strand:+ start:1005 stop:1460 length:456 start_codon:yes stop_codon:yes gene_type:complete
MTLLEIADLFKSTTDATQGLNGFSFGWASDRTRSQDYDSVGENSTNLFPRVFFAVPTLTNNPITRRDVYQITLFFDDLLGYNEDGTINESTQIQKWSALTVLAEKFMLQINTNKQAGNISEGVQMTLDSFSSIQRLISVQATFNLNVISSC